MKQGFRDSVARQSHGKYVLAATNARANIKTGGRGVFWAGLVIKCVVKGK
jgi:hypothetical protein